jgi:hypothetical protein
MAGGTLNEQPGSDRDETASTDPFTVDASGVVVLLITSRPGLDHFLFYSATIR